MLDRFRMAKRIEDLPIHSKVDEFWSAINAILDRPVVRKDSDLHDQISRLQRFRIRGFNDWTIADSRIRDCGFDD